MIINLTVFILVIANIVFINNSTSSKFVDYSTMLASKITKYVVTKSYLADDFNMSENKLYEIVRGEDGEIKTIIYDTAEVNKLLSKITDRVYSIFDELETGNLDNLNIRENILVNKKNRNFKEGIILEIPSGIVTNNFLFSNLGPKIPIRISLTGEFESFVSTKIEEYGLNNALISIYVDIRVTEQITMPFKTEKIVIENKIPISINLIAGKIPNYYLSGFDRTSNVYKSQ